MTKTLSNTDLQAKEALPYSQACENNKRPILDILIKEFTDCHKILEVGSGTGQHAVYFAANLPHIQWQTSDVNDNHSVINQWLSAYPAENLQPPIALDLRRPIYLTEAFDGVFTANTLHIMAWELVETLFRYVGSLLPQGGKFCVYGPFNYNGRFTSESNQKFDTHLRKRDPQSGIRDIEALIKLAKKYKLLLKVDHAMPANNRLLVFIKQEQ